jgi:hypothetical protein
VTAVRRPLLALLVVAVALAVGWYLDRLTPLALGLSLALVAVLALEQIVAFETSQRGQSILCWLFRGDPPWMGFRIETLWRLELMNRAIRRFFHLSTEPLGATHTLRRHYELRWAAKKRYACSTLCVHIYRSVEEMVDDYIRRGGSRDPGDIFELASLMGRGLVPLDSSTIADLILQSPDLLDVTLFGGEIEALRDYEEIIDLFPDKQLSIGNLVRVEFIRQLADSMAELFADWDEEDEDEPTCSECGLLLDPLDLVSDES